MAPTLKRPSPLRVLFVVLVGLSLPWGQARAGWGSKGKGSGEAKPRDYYEVLGVPKDAPEVVLKKQFRKLAL